MRSLNFDLSHSYKSGKPTALSNNALKAEVNAKPSKIIEELSNNLGRLSKNICKRRRA